MITTMIKICMMKASLMYNIDQTLIETIIKIESNYDVNARSSTNDHGLMQLNKKKIYDICQNIKVGTEMLQQCKNKYENKLGDAWIVCYNRGVHATKKLTKEKARRTKYYNKFKENYVPNKVYDMFKIRELDQQLSVGF